MPDCRRSLHIGRRAAMQFSEHDSVLVGRPVRLPEPRELHELLQLLLIDFPHLKHLNEQVAIEQYLSTSASETEPNNVLQSITFQELDKQSTQLHLALRAKLTGYADDGATGVRRLIERPRVAIMLSPSINAVVAIIAAWKCGASCLPLPTPTANEDNTEWAQHVQRAVALAAPTLLLCDSHSSALLSDDVLRTLPLIIQSEAIFSLASQMSASTRAAMEDDSTAIPGGDESSALLFLNNESERVEEWSHLTILTQMQGIGRALPYAKHERCLARAPLHSTRFVFELLVPLFFGRTVVLHRQSDLCIREAECKQLLQAARSVGVRRLLVDDSELRHLVDYLRVSKRAFYAQLRLIAVVGDAMPCADLLTDVFDVFPSCKIARLYEPAGVGGVLTWALIESDDDLNEQVSGREVPAGRPLINSSVVLLDECLQPVRKGLPGFVWATSEATRCAPAARLEADAPLAAFHVCGGAIGRIRTGQLYLVGHARRRIRVNGVTVDIQELESTLARPIELRRHFGYAVILLRGKGDDDETALKKALLKIVSVLPPTIQFGVPLPPPPLVEDDLIDVEPRTQPQQPASTRIERAFRSVVGVTAVDMGASAFDNGMVGAQLFQFAAALRHAGVSTAGSDVAQLASSESLLALASTSRASDNGSYDVRYFDELPAERVDQAVGIMAVSLAKHGDLDMYLESNATHYRKMIRKVIRQDDWTTCSFVLLDSAEQIVGVSLNANATPPDFDLLHDGEETRGQLPHYAQLIDACALPHWRAILALYRRNERTLPPATGMSTLRALFSCASTASDEAARVRMAFAMHAELLRLARRRRFGRIVSHSCTRLQQEMCHHSGFETTSQQRLVSLFDDDVGADCLVESSSSASDFVRVLFSALPREFCALTQVLLVSA